MSVNENTEKLLLEGIVFAAWKEAMKTLFEVARQDHECFIEFLHRYNVRTPDSWYFIENSWASSKVKEYILKIFEDKNNFDE